VTKRGLRRDQPRQFAVAHVGPAPGGLDDLRAAVTSERRGGAVAPHRCGPPRRFTELDAYRGLAALAVVVFHASGFVGHRAGSASPFYADTPLEVVLQQLNAGVIWFFVLSGFLIFLPFARAAIRQEGAIAPGNFLARRAIRILPLYYFVLLLIWSCVRGTIEDPWRDLLLHLTFTHVFDPEHFLWTIGPAWTLGVEVIFYCFVAAIGSVFYRICERLPSPQARGTMLLSSIGGLALISLGYTSWAFFAARIPFTNLPIYSGPVAMAHTFAFGMGLAVIVALIEGQPPLRRSPIVLLRLGWIVLSLLAIALKVRLPWGALYFGALFGFAFALVLASTALSERETAWLRALNHPILQFLGLISYSVYLWHESVIWILFRAHLIGDRPASAFPLGLLVVLGIVLGVASVSYWAIERPTRRLRSLFPPGGINNVPTGRIARAESR
jgi:peptidoglycan/LPS O-acetylase OafA/YrhL